jgi:hypothetical protein
MTFDLSSEEGLNEWMTKYNAEIVAGMGLPIPLPGEQSENAQKFRSKPKKAKGGRNRSHRRK